MSDHPEDTSENRFRATVAGVLAFFSFGLLTWLALLATGNEGSAEATMEGEFSTKEMAAYATNSAEVEAAQAALVDKAKVEAAMAKVAGSPKAPKASAAVVPGSETDLKNQAAAKAEKDAAEAAKGEPAPENSDAPKEEGKGDAPKAAAKGKGQRNKGKKGKGKGEGPKG